MLRSDRVDIRKLNPSFEYINGKAGDIVQFGNYPQSIALPGYEDCMQYDSDKKLFHCSADDCFYVKIEAKPYQPLFLNERYCFHSKKVVETGKAYFFKFEPINWIVLQSSAHTKFLLSEKVIDSKLYLEPKFVGKPRVDGYPNKYYPGVDRAFPNTWEYSTLRAWLNGTHTYQHKKNFFNFAFTREEQGKIKTVQLKNDPNSSGIRDPSAYSWLHQRDTKDKVFCLSVAEATSYIFHKDPKMKDSEICDPSIKGRAAEVTDYAIASGVCPYYIEGTIIGWWWLRSPGDPAEHEVTLYNKSKAPVCQKRACDVTEDGHICQRASIVCGSEEDTCDGSANGIRPAIKVEFE